MRGLVKVVREKETLYPVLLNSPFSSHMHAPTSIIPGIYLPELPSDFFEPNCQRCRPLYSSLRS
jgi:hypothetical protein